MKKLLVLALLVSIVVAGFSQRLTPKDATKFISIVTGGTFNNFPDKLIGEAFEEHFENPRWKYRKEGEENIVEFTGTFLDESGEMATVSMIFSVTEADRTFVLKNWSINDLAKENSEQYAFLESIFVPDTRDRAITLVREGYFYDYPDDYIGESFEEFFSEPNWGYFRSRNDEDVVEFSGKFYLDGEEVEAVFQFSVDLEERTFEVAYLGINDEVKDEDFIDFLLGSIFQSQIAAVKDSYFDVYYNWMTLGEAFDYFFTDPEWNYFLSSDEQDIVEFYGTFELGGIPADVYIQFEVFEENDYELFYWEIDGYSESINAFYLLLELIYY